MSYEDSTTWRGRTDSGIPYRLISRRGQVQYNQASGTEEILIESNQLANFILECFPPPRFFNGFPLYNPRRMPGLTRLVARDFEWGPWMDGLPIDPMGVDTTADELTYHPVIKITINYDNERKEDRQDPTKPETFLEASATTSAEVMVVNIGKALVTKKVADAPQRSQRKYNDTETIPPFPDDPDTTDESAQAAQQTAQNTDPSQTAVKVVPQQEWNLAWSKIDRTYFFDHMKPRLDYVIGKINDNDWPLLRSPAETLLFVGYDFKEQFYPVSPEDAPQFDWTDVSIDTVSVTLKFVEKCHFDEQSFEVRGHNHVWSDKDAQWVRPQFNGRPLYETTSFNNLIEAVIIPGVNGPI